ncbi:MAG: uncharacterized protein K0S45_3791, partial [Nitrospira sp.]|nr:uncharacterized protein [Nitrospira sp.]
FVMDLFKKIEQRDPAEVVPRTLPEPFAYKSQREFVRKVLREEVHFRANGKEIVSQKNKEPERSLQYRQQMNSEGSPTETVAAGYQWAPGTELSRKMGVAV